MNSFKKSKYNDFDIIKKFTPVDSEYNGKHRFDFLGTRYRYSYNKSSLKNTKSSGTFRSDAPPVNEHYPDWVTLLCAIQNAKGTFRMAELGAGWAPWLVRAAFASKQREEIKNLELLGIEADQSHFSWMIQHFLDNDINPNDHNLIFGAVSGKSEILKFPVIANPDEVYGASILNSSEGKEYTSVKGYTLNELLNKFSGPLDLLHVDVQGAEYEIFQTCIKELKSKIKLITVGTHYSCEKHHGLAKLFKDHGWNEEMNFPRLEKCNTPVGEIQFGDGFLLYSNPTLLQ